MPGRDALREDYWRGVLARHDADYATDATRLLNRVEEELQNGGSPNEGGVYRIFFSYYESLGTRHFGELQGELIYLKRLGRVPLSGRDLLYFKSESSRSELIYENLSEYVACIDAVLEQWRQSGLTMPLDVIIANAPTMDDLIEKRKAAWYRGAYVNGTQHETPNSPQNSPVTLGSFDFYDKCFKGRLFDKYPDQVQHCKVINYPIDKAYQGLWTTTRGSCIEREILGRGLYVAGIHACVLKAWKRNKREPDFTNATDANQIQCTKYGTDGVEYTGRSHRIQGTEFFEINLNRSRTDRGKEVGNPFLELVEEVLREAENELRERQGLPRIGEGWVSEIRLYKLVRNNYPDAVLHVSPVWLKPQHLDVYVESERLAFEYQGQQHFEPIEFFGGPDAFKETTRRDKLKVRKCRSNGVRLICWRFDEPIASQVLAKKLEQIGLQ